MGKHCLTLQAVHQVCSFVTSIFGASLARVAYFSNCISFWIGGLGCFVTVQYVVLVHNNVEFKAACQERISRDPPDNLRRKCLILHIFALPLAILDISLARNHSELREDASIVVTLCGVLFYVLFYL